MTDLKVFMRFVNEKRQNIDALSTLVARAWAYDITFKAVDESVELIIDRQAFIKLNSDGILPTGLSAAFERAEEFNALYKINAEDCRSRQGPWVSCNLNSDEWPETLITVQPS